MPRFDELDRLVRGADGVLRCMDCGEELDRPEETGKEPEKGSFQSVSLNTVVASGFL